MASIVTQSDQTVEVLTQFWSKMVQLRLSRNPGPYTDLLNSTRYVLQKTVLDSCHHSQTHARALKAHIQHHYSDVSVFLGVLLQSIPA